MLTLLDAATNMERVGAAEYLATIAPEWSAWAPNGGYLATLALRAAALETRFVRPAALSCAFLHAAEPGEARVHVKPIQNGIRADTLRVAMDQHRRPIFESLIRFVADKGRGIQHEAPRRADVPPPEELPVFDVVAASLDMPMLRFMELRLALPLGDSTPAARLAVWIQYRPKTMYRDMAVDLGRVLIPCDILYWFALQDGYAEPVRRYTAPNLSLDVSIHELPREDADWLYCEAAIDRANDGLVGGSVRVWSRDGTLLASALTQAMFVRRRVSRLE